MFTQPEVNNCFSIIFRGADQELQNNGLKHENTDAVVRVHTRTLCAAVVLIRSLHVHLH